MHIGPHTLDDKDRARRLNPVAAMVAGAIGAPEGQPSPISHCRPVAPIAPTLTVSEIRKL